MAPLRFNRLIRFRTENGPQYGDAILPPSETDSALASQAKIIELDEPGNIFGGGRVTNKVVVSLTNFTIQKFNILQLAFLTYDACLLEPISPALVGTVRCLGLNYANHAKESNMSIPTNPVLFYKPRTSLSGTNTPITVSKMFQNPPSLDYECELVIVIGKPCRNVSPSEALGYVFGYTAGNDVSHREWQLKKGGGQWSMGKAGDGWAPIGPAIVSSKIIKNPQTLKISSKVNGKVMQSSNTSDMIFGVAETVSFLSQGTTLMPGDLIFTGTPEGVGMARSPPVWLKDGDEVEISIDGIGTIKNRVEFERENPKAKL